MKNDDRTVYGEPIYFSFPATVRNVNGAIAFGEYLLSTDVKDILKNQGLNPIKPLMEGDITEVPSSIRRIIANQ